MKIQDIPEFMGRSASDLAADFGIPKQTLSQYLNGQRGKVSKLISNLLIFCNLNQEQIIFPDRFDHPNGENPEHQAYWANIAIEAIRKAEKQGMNQHDANKVVNEIYRLVLPSLSDHS